jgi:hypothetical protein
MLTKNLSQTEVKSRLSALATTLDSRGWAVKNINVNVGGISGYFEDQTGTDRLVDTSSIVREVPVVDVHASDDILDEHNNPTAQKFKNLMVQAEVDRRQALQNKLEVARTNAPAAPEPEMHMHAETIHDLKPLSGMPSRPSQTKGSSPAGLSSARPTPPVTERGQAAKLELAQSGNDLSVASIAKLAGRNSGAGDEVEIALH